MSIIDKIEQLISEAESINVDTKKDQTGHMHKGKVDTNGHGATTKIIGNATKHVHKIFQWLVQPSNGHTHNLEE